MGLALRFRLPAAGYVIRAARQLAPGGYPGRYGIPSPGVPERDHQESAMPVRSPGRRRIDGGRASCI